MLGDRRNRSILRAAVQRFVCLRRYEDLSLGRAMHGLRPSALPFLADMNAGKPFIIPVQPAAEQTCMHYAVGLLDMIQKH